MIYKTMSLFIRFASVGLALVLFGCNQQEVAFTSQVHLVTTEQPDVYDVSLILKETQGNQVLLALNPSLRVLSGEEGELEIGNTENLLKFSASVTGKRASEEARVKLILSRKGRVIYSEARTVSINEH